MSTTNATLTIISSRKPDQLTKLISLSEDGKMVKQPSAQLYEGTADVATLTTITDFAELLTSLQPNQALVYGVPNNGITHANIVTEKRKELGVTQEQLALDAAIDRTYVSQIERGIGNPSLLILVKIVPRLETEVQALLTPNLDKIAEDGQDES